MSKSQELFHQALDQKFKEDNLGASGLISFGPNVKKILEPVVLAGLILECLDSDQIDSLVKAIQKKEENEKPWIPIEENIDFFSEIKLYTPYFLSETAIETISGCLGYALREVIRGEDLSLPEIIRLTNGITLTYYYDSTKTHSDDPDFSLAFEKARKYWSEGTPKRKTDKSGPFTKGTSLVPGLTSTVIPGSIQIFTR